MNHLPLDQVPASVLGIMEPTQAWEASAVRSALQQLVRVSIQEYNTEADVEGLTTALAALLASGI